MGLNPKGSPIQVTIISWLWGAYLGDEGLRQGIRVKTSSFIRHHVNIMMTKTKTVGNYVNSIMAKLEAVQAGYDEALLLDTAGYVCEASGENIFIVKDGVLKTPPLTSILPGITRDCIITIAKDLGLKVKEDRFSRDELYLADEAFFTGTAAEVTPIRDVDARIIGPGSARPHHQANPGGLFCGGQRRKRPLRALADLHLILSCEHAGNSFFVGADPCVRPRVGVMPGCAPTDRTLFLLL